MSNVISFMARARAGRSKLVQDGQEIECYLLPAKTGKHHSFVMQHHFGIEFLASGAATGQEVAVLFAMVSRMDFNNHVYASQTDLAEAVGTSKQNINKILKRLHRKHRLVMPSKKLGNTTVWMINPDFVSKVSLKPHLELINLYQSLEHDTLGLEAGETVLDMKSA